MARRTRRQGLAQRLPRPGTGTANQRHARWGREKDCKANGLGEIWQETKGTKWWDPQTIWCGKWWKILDNSQGFHSTEPALCDNFDCFEAWKTAAATGFEQGELGSRLLNISVKGVLIAACEVRARTKAVECFVWGQQLHVHSATQSIRFKSAGFQVEDGWHPAVSTVTPAASCDFGWVSSKTSRTTFLLDLKMSMFYICLCSKGRRISDVYHSIS